MSEDLASDFYELKRPRTFGGATLRFLVFAAIASVILFVSPNSWGKWQTGLIIGLFAGALWATSWRWKGAENRLIVWLVIYLGGMVLWGVLYGDFPSLGALACMYVGFEFVLLILHNHLRKWTNHTARGKEAEQASAGNS